MNKKTLLTIGALMPLIFFVVMFAWQISFVLSIGADMEEAVIGSLFLRQMTSMYVASLLLMFLLLITKAYFIRNALTNEALKDGGPTTWLVLFLLFSTIPMMVYLFKYIYHKPWRVMFSTENHKQGGRVIGTGILAFAPLAIVMGIYGSILGLFEQLSKGGDIDGSMSMGIIAGSLVIFYLLLLLSMAIGFIVFTILIAQNKDMTGGRKAAWIVTLFFLNVNVMVIYWWLHEYLGTPHRLVAVEGHQEI